MDAQKTQTAKAILRRKDKAGGITHPDVRQYKKVQESSNQNSIALAQKETYRSPRLTTFQAIKHTLTNSK